VGQDMLYLLQNITTASDLKACALFVTNLLGHPNLEQMLSRTKFMMTLSVAFLVGITSIHFVK